MAQTGKRMPTTSSWSYQDKDKIISGVQNIIKGGSGKTESYDPSLMAKISQSLNLVDDYAHGVSQEEIDDKYNSIPEDYKNTLKMTSQGVNAKGSMSNFELTSQAKSYGVNLSDEEKNLLQERPGIQQSYLQVKKKSANIDSRSMEATMGTIMNDVQTGRLQHKGQLKVRLQNVLNMENIEDVDYLAEDLWADLTTNKTSNEKMDRIRTKYKELFGFKDRTGWQKTKETGMGLLNGLQEAVTNGLSWLTEAGTDLGLSIGYGMGKVFGEDAIVPKDVDLWGIDENALSPETKEMVEKLRAYGVGSGVVSAMDVYFKAQEETYDAQIDDFFKDASFPYKDDAKDSETLRENSNYVGVGEFVGKSIPEIYITSKIGAMLPMSAVKNAPWYVKLGYYMLKKGGEGTAFSVMEEGDVDKLSVGTYVASSVLIEPLFNTIGSKLSKRGIKKYFGKGWNDTVKDVMNYGDRQATRAVEGQAVKVEEQAIKEVADEMATKLPGSTSRANAEKYIVETVAEKLPNEFSIIGGGNVLDESAKVIDKAVEGIQGDITSSLSRVEGKYENKHIHNMLKEVFGQTDREVEEAYAIFKNARAGAGMSDEAIDKEWNAMMDLYLDGTNKFTLVEQEQIKRNMRTIAKTYNSSNKPLNGRLPQRWRNEQISAQNVLKGYAEKNGILTLGDQYLQESVLIRASEGFSQNAPKNMMDIINRYAGRTLVGGIGGYVASQTIGDGPLSNPYIATASTILAMALGGSPRVSLAVSKFASSKMSLIEARAIINSAEDGTLPKLDKYTFEGATEHLKEVLYTDSLLWLTDEISGANERDIQPVLSTDDIDFGWNQYSSMGDDEIYDI